MKSITFIYGGHRSGKTTLAHALAKQMSEVGATVQTKPVKIVELGDVTRLPDTLQTVIADHIGTDPSHLILVTDGYVQRVVQIIRVLAKDVPYFEISVSHLPGVTTNAEAKATQ